MTLGSVFTAHYGGECEGCNEPVVPGEDIRSTGTGYVHADDQCERVVGAQRFGRAVSAGQDPCPRCFQMRSVSGACGCDA